VEGNATRTGSAFILFSPDIRATAPHSHPRPWGHVGAFALGTVGASGRLRGPYGARPAARAASLRSGRGAPLVARDVGLLPFCRRRDRLIASRGRLRWERLAPGSTGGQSFSPTWLSAHCRSTRITGVTRRRGRRRWLRRRARTESCCGAPWCRDPARSTVAG
jgi:hypothetical protein